MTEVELIKQFAAARGLTMRGTLNRATSRTTLLPLLILDIAYRYVTKLRIDDFRFKARHYAKEIHKAYNHANQWFFVGLKDQLEDAAIDLMDDLEKSLDLDILVMETQTWNIFKAWPEPVCSQLVACYMAHCLSSAANATWETVFRSSNDARTRNRDMIRIADQTKRLAQVLMATESFDATDRYVEALRSAESVLGHKLVRWTTHEPE